MHWILQSGIKIAEKFNRDGKFIFIVNLNDWGFKHFNKEIMSKEIKLLQTYYIERIHSIHVYPSNAFV